jgi:hypothetical protein
MLQYKILTLEDLEIGNNNYIILLNYGSHVWKRIAWLVNTLCILYYSYVPCSSRRAFLFETKSVSNLLMSY